MVKEKDNELLTKLRDKNIQQNKAAGLVARTLSPSLVFLRDSPYVRPNIAESETYSRSEKNPLTKNTSFLYSASKSELTMGHNAHLGNYQNLMQNLGDEYASAGKRKETSAGNADLYNQMLEYKKSICLRVVAKSRATKYIKITYANDFPCIMVHVKKSSFIKPNDAAAPTEASYKAWVDFLISIFTGMINYYAYENDIPIELERRASFGFLTPTICETGESFRISVGIVPEAYADLLTTSLQKLDELIQALHTSKTKIPAGIFYGTKLHEEYLGKKPIKIDNLLHILFVPVETRSGLGVYAITRTAYARQGLAITMFNSLCCGDTPTESFLTALNWSVQKIYVEIKYRTVKGKQEVAKRTLKFKCDEIMTCSTKFKSKNQIIVDPNFWLMISSILSNVGLINKTIISDQVRRITSENINTKQLTTLHYNLELLNELIFCVALAEKPLEIADDGQGSDSECENEIEATMIYAKKKITHNGMRAIWCALLAAANYLSEHKLGKRVYIKTAYYEVEKGLKKLQNLHNITDMTFAKNAADASILLHDLNACVTDGVPKADYTITASNKILILDVTSSTSAQVATHIKRFAQSRAAVLFLVDSGFKHQQLGADKNQYGTVRVFTRDKKARDKIYASITENEMGILSKTSHIFRRKMKQVGAVPTNASYLSHKNLLS
jgi:hypothetical protein